MAVNLSPVGGVAAQFFDNSGNVLTGGKIYTYSAGTTTPATTYTTSAGSTPWSNPIVLDASGRVSGSGEVWLTDSIAYKFVLKDSNDVLIATYDNITGINSNFVNFVSESEIQIATAGQTVFNLTTMQYQPGTNNLLVFVDGVNQYEGSSYSFVETDENTVTFVSGLHVGAEVKFTTATPINTLTADAATTAYTAPYTDSVTTNVEAKLAQYVSVKDFGATGDGVTDDTTFIQNALDSGESVFFPSGTYIVSDELVPLSNQMIYGDGQQQTQITQTDGTKNVFTLTSKSWVTIKQMTLSCSETSPTNAGVYIEGGGNNTLVDLRSSGFGNGVDFVSTGTLWCQRLYISGSDSHGIHIRSSGVSSVAIQMRDCYSLVNGGDGIRFTGLSDGTYLDTMELSSNTGSGYYAVGDGTGNPTNVFNTKLVCDSNGVNGIYVGSGASGHSFNGCWTSNRGSGKNWYINAADCNITGGNIYDCYGHGLEIDGAFCNVSGLYIHNAGSNAADTYDGIYANGNSPSITGCYVYSGNSGASDKTRHAITLGSSVVYGSVTGGSYKGVFNSVKVNVLTTDPYTLVNGTPTVKATFSTANKYGSTFGTTTVANGATATLCTLDSNGQNASYLLFAGQNGAANAGIRLYAFIKRGGSVASIYVIESAGGFNSITMNGLDVEFTNGAGGTLNADWTLLKIIGNGAT